MLHRAPRLGMNQRQCPELLEGVEGIDFLTSTLIYPIHAESQRPLPNAILIDSPSSTGTACSATPHWPKPFWIGSRTARTRLPSRVSQCVSRPPRHKAKQ